MPRPARALALAALVALACKPPPPETPLDPPEPEPAAAPAPEPPRAHHWQGALALPGGAGELVFFVAFRPEGEGYKGRLTIPKQGLLDGELAEVVYADGSIAFTFAPTAARWTGTYDQADSIECELSQGTVKLPCEMEPIAAEAYAAVSTLNRPQEPKPPFPYAAREVTFKSADGTELAGTLTVPEGEGPHPAVVLISGSGPQDRDETLLGHKPFLLIADHLTRSGVAVLRYDDRGVGGSSGSTATSTSEDFSSDALAAVELLSAQPEVDGARVGLVGHSEGGIVAPIAATRGKSVAFIVLLAGTGVPGHEVVTHQGGLIARAGGADEGMIKRSAELNAEVFRILRENPDEARAREAITAYLKKALSDGEKGLMQAMGVKDVETFIAGQLEMVLTPWFRHFLDLDPRAALRRVKVPVLILNGELDLQVDPEQNVPEIVKALKKARNRDVTVERLPGLNHLFQEANTGHPAEYVQIEQTMAPAVLELVSNWILARFGQASGAGAQKGKKAKKAKKGKKGKPAKAGGK